MSPSFPWSILGLTCCLAASTLGSAEYTLVKEEGPGSGIFQGRYVFFVPEPAADAEPAELEFKEVSISGRAGMLHAVTWPMAYFWRLNENTSLCTKDGRVDTSEVVLQSQAVVKELFVGMVVSDSFKLSRAGGHVLTFINCASSDPMTISGTIRVKSSWGYLDALEYYRVPIYVCALVMSGILVLVYSLAIYSQEGAARDTQVHCLLLGLLCFAEAGLTCFELYMRNAGTLDLDLAGCLYLAKLMYGLSFIAKIVQGLGFTEESLDWARTAKCYVCATVFSLAVVPKLHFFSMRPHSPLVDGDSLFKCTAPIVAVSFVILGWVMWSLRNLLGELDTKIGDEASVAAKRFVGLFVFVIVSSGLVLVGQLTTEADISSKSYWSHALWNDAFASVIFTATVAAMMWFSMEDHSVKYMQVVEDGSDNEVGTLVSKDPPAADTIGAAVE